MRYKFVGYSTKGNLSLPKILHDRDLAQQDLLNEIHTRKGERVMSPTFGCVAWDILFDPFIVRESQEQGINAEVSLTYVPTTEPVTLNIKFDENATVEF